MECLPVVPVFPVVKRSTSLPNTLRVPTRVSRRSVVGAWRVDCPRRGLAPFFTVDQLGEGATPNVSVAADGASERESGGDDRFVGNGQKRSELGLHCVVPAGHDAAVAEGSGRQEEVLAGR